MGAGMPVIKPSRYWATVTGVDGGRVVLLVDQIPELPPRAFTLARSLLPASVAVGLRVVLWVREVDGRLQARVEPKGHGKFDFRGQWGER